jgi:hypothetical protein
MSRDGRGRGRALLATMGGGGSVPPQVLTLFGTPVTTGYENDAYSTWQVSAIGGTAPYSYALVGTYPAGISIDSGTGVISGTPTEDGTFASLNVEVTDAAAGTDQLDSNFSIVITTELSISGTPNTDIWQNEAYSGFDVDAAGGSGGNVFALVGTWPSGISINSGTGVVSGTTAVYGSFPSLSVSVTDNSGHVRSLSSFTLNVGQQVGISGTPVTSGTEGVAYTGFTATAFGGDGSYTYSLRGTWPTGISIDSGTGVVSGTPSQSGTFTGLSVRVTDGRSKTADLSNFTLTLAAAPSNFVITDTISDGTDITGASLSTTSLTGKSIGSAAADRLVVFALQFTQTHQGRQQPVVTCDGTEMMLAAMNEHAANLAPTQIYIIPKATGTTADFVITWPTTDANLNIPRYNAFVAKVTGMSIVPSDFTAGFSTSFPSASAVTLDIDANTTNAGLAIGIGGADCSGAPSSETWTGLTADQTLTIETLRTTIAHRVLTSSETPRNIDFVIGGGVNVFAPSACVLTLAPSTPGQTLFWDTFDRADSVLGSSLVPSGFTNANNWVWDSRTPQVNIVSNKLTNNNTNGPGTVYHVDVGHADHWVEWWVDNTTASNGPFAALRIVDYDNFIGVRVAGTNIEVYRREASSMNSLVSTNYDAAFGTLFRLEAQSTSLRVYRNGILQTTQTIASPFLTPTKCGIVGRSTVLSNFLSRFRCGTL